MSATNLLPTNGASNIPQSGWADHKLPAHVVQFRVLQEALTDVHRHSGTPTAGVVIQKSAGQVILEVRDNGRGKQPEMLDRFRESGAGAGVGLISMQERARELGGKPHLESSAAGTLVRIGVPIPIRC